MKKFKLSIILPCYNEENNILASFKVVLRSLKTSKIKNFEIIFVDDGSTDKSKKKIKKIIKNFKNKFLIKKKFLSKNLGLGGAFRIGVQKSTGTHAIFIPTDNSHPTKGLSEIFTSFENKKRNQILISYVKNKNARSLIRRIISKTYTIILNIVFLNKIKYFNGLNIYPRAILLKNLNKTNGFAFQTEIILMALKDRTKYYNVGTTISERQRGITRAFKLENIFQVFGSIIKLIYRYYVK